MIRADGILREQWDLEMDCSGYYCSLTRIYGNPFHTPQAHICELLRKLALGEVKPPHLDVTGRDIGTPNSHPSEWNKPCHANYPPEHLWDQLEARLYLSLHSYGTPWCSPPCLKDFSWDLPSINHAHTNTHASGEPNVSAGWSLGCEVEHGKRRGQADRYLV